MAAKTSRSSALTLAVDAQVEGGTMSDFYDTSGEWWGYDPAYVGEEQEDNQNDTRPVDPDDWSNEDLEGGF